MVVWFFEFDDIPQVFRDYIAARASRIAVTRMVNDEKAVKLLSADEALLRSWLLSMTLSRLNTICSKAPTSATPTALTNPFNAVSR